jgi:hypothetical protein
MISIDKINKLLEQANASLKGTYANDIWAGHTMLTAYIPLLDNDGSIVFLLDPEAEQLFKVELVASL